MVKKRYLTNISTSSQIMYANHSTYFFLFGISGSEKNDGSRALVEAMKMKFGKWSFYIH